MFSRWFSTWKRWRWLNDIIIAPGAAATGISRVSFSGPALFFSIFFYPAGFSFLSSFLFLFLFLLLTNALARRWLVGASCKAKHTCAINSYDIKLSNIDFSLLDHMGFSSFKSLRASSEGLLNRKKTWPLLIPTSPTGSTVFFYLPVVQWLATDSHRIFLWPIKRWDQQPMERKGRKDFTLAPRPETAASAENEWSSRRPRSIHQIRNFPQPGRPRRFFRSSFLCFLFRLLSDEFLPVWRLVIFERTPCSSPRLVFVNERELIKFCSNHTCREARRTESCSHQL